MDKKQIEMIYSLSPQQQGMLFEHLYAAEAGLPGVHIEQFTCIVHGPLDQQAFERAWQRIVERHPALRTAFVWKDQPEPLQVALRRVTLPFERHDWRGLAPEVQRERLQAYLAADRQRGFDLAAAPLTRLALFQIDDRSHQVVWTFHHMLLDGWCQPIVLNEVFATYLAFRKGQEASLPPARPYRDYITWLKKQDLSATKQFWQETLKGFSAPTALGVVGDPQQFPALPDRYGYLAVSLPANELYPLQMLAQQHRVTLSTVVQGVWALLLYRYSRQSNLVFGTTVSGRPPELAGVESMIGLFISTLPLRVQVAPEAPFWAWLRDVQARHLRLQQYGYCSAGQIHQWSELPGSLPLYESLLVFENYPIDAAAFPASEITIDLGEARVVGAQTNHAITLLITAAAELSIQIVYDRRRIHNDDIPHILDHMLILLRSAAAVPEQPVAMLANRVPADQSPRILALGETQRSHSADGYVAPRTPTEATMERIWAEILGVERVGIHNSFFELGGYSLLAIELATRMRDAFQVELPLRHLFEAPTIADLALVIAQKQAEQVDSATLEQLLDDLEQMT